MVTEQSKEKLREAVRMIKKDLGFDKRLKLVKGGLKRIIPGYEGNAILEDMFWLIAQVEARQVVVGAARKLRRKERDGLGENKDYDLAQNEFFERLDGLESTLDALDAKETL